MALLLFGNFSIGCTAVAFTFFEVLFCDGSAGGHILTTIRMTFPRNACSNYGVDFFWVLFCDGSASAHILTNFRMTFPRNGLTAWR